MRPPARVCVCEMNEKVRDGGGDSAQLEQAIRDDLFPDGVGSEVRFKDSLERHLQGLEASNDIRERRRAEDIRRNPALIATLVSHFKNPSLIFRMKSSVYA